MTTIKIKLEKKTNENEETYFYVTRDTTCLCATQDEEKARKMYNNLAANPDYYSYQIIEENEITLP